MPRSVIAGWALGGLALGLLAVATFGLSTRRVVLSLGPGDTPFVSGFTNESEVAEKVGWHWTTYDAAIDLPFATRGSDLDVTLRYARVFGEESVSNLRVGEVETEPFRARGGEVRSTLLHARGVKGAVHLVLKTDSHERRNLGLKMDGLAIEVVSGDPLRLRPGAALWPLASLTILMGGLLALGTSPVVAGGGGLVAALAFVIRAWFDLFGAWRQVSLAPVMLVFSTLVLLVARRWMIRAFVVEKTAATWLTAAALMTVLFRLSLVSHPDFYYPDLLTHARVVEAIRNEGPTFFLDPSAALNAQGAWTKPVLGRAASLPYAVMFHAPFALAAAGFDLSMDQIETALLAASCLISVLPILLTAALAARVSIPPVAALLLCVIPVYTSRLSFALMPALWGHVFDLAVLLIIATMTSFDGMRSRRSFATVAAALFLGHLAYTSSVVNEGLFVALLSAWWFTRSGRVERGQGLRLLIAEGAAALGAFAVYYRHFVGDVFGLITRMTGTSAGIGGGPGSASASVYPIESFWGLLFERTNTFFGWSYLALALVGLALSGPAVRRSRLVGAWATTYLVLILLRARIPDVFRYGHETLFLTPLVTVLAGAALVLGFRKGGAVRLASVVACLCLVVVSIREQWMAVADQLGNAL